MDHPRSAERTRSIRAACEAVESRLFLSATFASPAATSLAGVQSPVVTAQFDTNSNFADLAATTPGSVKILLGNTFGTFTAASSIPLPANPATQTPFLVGNFSGNGSDIVLLSQNSATHNGVITYETSQNDGTFTAFGTTPITNHNHGFDPIAGAVADFNSDSNIDLAILGKPTTGSSLVLVIMTSNGDGTFTESQDYTVNGSNTAGNLDNNTVLTASLDGGPPDIVLYDGSAGNLDVFMGAGDGSFTQLASVPLTATQLITDTFTGSGSPDLIAANGTQLTALLGNGDGTFTAQTPITLGGTLSSLASADMDLDGNPDIITNLGVLYGNGDGTFQNPISLPVAEGGSTFSTNIIPLDLDGDGRPDLVGISSDGNMLLSIQNITPTSSSVSLGSSANPASPGGDVQFTASVSSSLSLQLTGQVDFFDGSTLLGSAQLQPDGTATLDAGTALTPGAHSITAQYEGNSDFFSSTSDPFSQSILFLTTTVVTSGENPSGSGDAVTFTAAVTGNDGNGDIPTGNVEFFDGTTDLGGGALDANGNATFDDTQLTGGAHQITAEYQADSNYAASTSAALTQTAALPPLAPEVKSSTLPASIVAGTSAHGIAIVELTNTTQSSISSLTNVTVFASTDGSVIGATQLVSLPIRNIDIPAGKAVSVRVPITSLPAGLGDGTYMLIAQATYNSGTVSAAASGPSIQIAAAFTSLAETLSAPKLPASLVTGTSINGSIKVIITNNGNVASKGATSFSISFSTQQDQPGTAIPALTRNLSIKPGATLSLLLPIKSLLSVPAGDYFLVVQVTDPNGNDSIATTQASIPIAAPLVTLSARLGPVTNVNNGDTVTITNTGNTVDSTSITSSLGFSTDAAGAQPLRASTVVLGNPVQIKPGKSIKLHLNQWKSLLSALTVGSRYYLTVTVTDSNGVTAFAVSSTAFTA